jgi:hypothetical protein
MKRTPKRLCDDAIYQHLQQGIENDRVILSKQWQQGKVNTAIDTRYKNNIRKLEQYADGFIGAQT